MKMLNFLSSLLVLLVLFMILSGGTILQIGGAKIELASVDLWAITSMVIGSFYWRKTRSLPFSFGIVSNWAWRIIESDKAKQIFWCLVIFFSLILFVVHSIKHLGLNTHAWDMGYVNQAIFYPFGPQFLNCDMCKTYTYLSEHISFSLMLLAPLFSVFKSNFLVFAVEVLLVTAAIVVAISKGPIKNKERIWWVIFFIIICNRSLRNSLIWDFREDHVGFFFLLLSLTALYCKRFILYFLCLIGALLSKEHIGLMTAFLAFPICFDSTLGLKRQHKFWLSAGTVAMSLVWVIVAFKILFPYYTAIDQSQSNIVLRFGQYGQTPKDILLNVLFTPQYWWEILRGSFLKMGAIKYIVLMLGPYMYFLRKGFWWLFPAFAGLALNIMSPLSNERMMIFHYDLVILPYLIIGLLVGVKALSKDETTLKRHLFIGAVIAISLSGRWPLFYIKSFNFNNFKSSIFLSQIQTEKTVAANYKTLAQLTHLPHLRSFEDGNGKLIWGMESCLHRFSCIREVEVIVLDRLNDSDQELFTLLIKESWKITGRDPSDRYIIMGK